MSPCASDVVGRVVRREELGLDLGCPECGIDGLGRIVELDRHKMQWLGILVVRYKYMVSERQPQMRPQVREASHETSQTQRLHVPL